MELVVKIMAILVILTGISVVVGVKSVYGSRTYKVANVCVQLFAKSGVLLYILYVCGLV